MKKKLLMLATALLMATAGHAQFEKGKYYVGGSLSGVNFQYNKSDKWNIGIGGQMGYLFADSWMVIANLGYQYQYENSALAIGPAARYYIVQNGLFVGAGLNFVHRPSNINEVSPHLSVGYAFFLNGNVTVEPEIYYNQSFNNHDYSGIGLRVGVGYYF